MTNTDINNFQKNLHPLFNEVLNSNEPLNIITPTGNAILLSESEYNNLIETLYFYDIPKMKEKANEIKK